MNLLSIIIVTYRSTDLLLACIRSVYQFNPTLPAEIIVVDNAFGDNSRDIVTLQFPEVRWIEMADNAGFARGNNAGIRAAKGDLILLLNPDTLALDDSISRCAKRLRESNYAAAGVQLLDVNHEPQISGSFFIKGGLNHLLPIPYWGDFIRWAGYRAKATVPGVQTARAVEEVDWISGAFLMVKRTVIETTGLLDEDFFLYGEEVEWCSRLQKAGKLVLFGDLKIVHLEGATINKSQQIEEKGYANLYDRKGLQLMVSNHLRVRKHYGVGWFMVLLLNYTVGVFVFLIAGFIHQLFLGKRPLSHFRKVIAFGKNVWRLWMLLPTIVRNKPHFYKMF